MLFQLNIYCIQTKSKIKNDLLGFYFITLWQSAHVTDDAPNIPNPSAHNTHWDEPFPVACFFILSRRSINLLNRNWKKYKKKKKKNFFIYPIRSCSKSSTRWARSRTFLILSISSSRNDWFICCVIGLLIRLVTGRLVWKDHPEFNLFK
jgi:hypothetical protein